MRWIACAEPERPPDSETSYHLMDCRGCIIAAEAAARRRPGNRNARLIAGLVRDYGPHSRGEAP